MQDIFSYTPSPSNIDLYYDCNLTYKIQGPLINTECALFRSNLENDAIYHGANEVLLNSGKLPRTLYHLFFIYFALKNGNQADKYPILDSYTYIQDEVLPLDEEEKYKETVQKFHPEILNFIEKRNLILEQLTWQNIVSIVNDIFNEFTTIKASYDHYKSRDPAKRNLFYHFYRFCYQNNEQSEKLKMITMRALALEWSSPSGTEVLYRSSQLSADDIQKEENCAHSLSFSVSLYSGLVFEGTPTGTCPYVYYNHYLNKQLFALALPYSKIKKYFFYPSYSYDLLPLTAFGEFSHPRLHVFLSKETLKVSGVQGQAAQLEKLAAQIASAKISDAKAFRDKVIKIFQKHFQLLGESM